jgi:hypothetical protein
MLRLLYDRYPQVTQIATGAPGHDAALLTVDRRLGPPLHHRTNEYRIDVTGPPATNRSYNAANATPICGTGREDPVGRLSTVPRGRRPLLPSGLAPPNTAKRTDTANECR